MENQAKQNLSDLYQKVFDQKVETIEEIPLSGSNRRYYRLFHGTNTAIGAFNTDRKENEAFVNFTTHFLSHGVKVPKIHAQDLDKGIYLLEDLGDTTLLQQLFKTRQGDDFPEEIKAIYKKVVKDLAHLQIVGGRDLDYSYCYPTALFDKKSMLWDCNYFKYYFLKVCGLPFDEEKLEDDFRRLVAYLGRNKHHFFVFRDFQARNIMVKDGEPHYIDYQGGRQGALQYDLASLLYQAKANIPHEIREELLDDYINAVASHIEIDKKQFKRYYYYFVLIRCIQVLGAYGFRGLYERKAHFLTSIPFALDNVAWLLDNVNFKIKIPYLKYILKELTHSKFLRDMGKEQAEYQGLTITISSFSYRRGIPQDFSGNGGGFVFDCRAIHNPGRYAPYKKLTGRDQPVIDFLESKSNIKAFIDAAKLLVDNAVENYLERNFSHLMVSFGCTGGQHRSVYSTDTLAKYLNKKYDVNVVVNHIEQELKNWVN